jgi:hypothetical protein
MDTRTPRTHLAPHTHPDTTGPPRSSHNATTQNIRVLRLNVCHELSKPHARLHLSRQDMGRLWWCRSQRSTLGPSGRAVGSNCKFNL